MCLVSLRTVALVSSVALAAPAAYAQVYKWVDGQGKVHYGDTPPEGQKNKPKPLELLDDRPTGAQASEAQVRLKRYQGELQKKPPAASAPVASPATVFKPVEPTRPASCSEQWQQYDEAYACFNPYRNANGSVKAEGFRNCPEVKVPECPNPGAVVPWN